MPYNYRKMSSEERAILVEQRRQRGYPMHAPPHPYREAGWYLITAANYEHKPIMQQPERRDNFERELLGVFRSINAEIGGWVILPNHYHILAGLDTLDSISALLKNLHGKMSRDWNLADQMPDKRRVWYKFTDRWIRNEQHYYQTLNYIHYNPVKHGCIDDPYQWPWSSVHLYYDTKGCEWLRETWQNHPINNYGQGWDD